MVYGGISGRNEKKPKCRPPLVITRKQNLISEIVKWFRKSLNAYCTVARENNLYFESENKNVEIFYLVMKYFFKNSSPIKMKSYF